MPQSLGNATGYSASTTYDAGVAELTDSANIIDAFKYYHYGENFNGSTGLGGIEKHFRDVADDIALVTASVSTANTNIENNKHLTILDRTSSHTFTLANDGALVTYTGSASTTFTIPPESGAGSVAFSLGTQINVLQKSTGQVLISPGTGVTINGTPGKRTRTQWSLATAIKIASNNWVVIGDTTT